jgi:hypothetical protein
MVEEPDLKKYEAVIKAEETIWRGKNVLSAGAIR